MWNKSHRGHLATHSEPGSVRTEADQATEALSWDGSYYVDADHIGLQTVDLFMDSSDFFTIDVAEAIGQPSAGDDLTAFVDRHERCIGTLEIPGIAEPFSTSLPVRHRATRAQRLPTPVVPRDGRPPRPRSSRGGAGPGPED